ncbi:MAG: ABC transporter permease, partial [Clostridiaceae bacterium]|nr:ABC transporter permease [Clostridiaceae bacterium]
GTRISLLVGIVASFLILIIGSVYGSVSGLAGGRVDLVMMRIVEVIYTIPDILIIIILMVTLKKPLERLFETSPIFDGLSLIGPGLISIFITFSLLYWVGMARLVRGQVLMLKEQEFVTAARAMGGSNARIIRRHLIPNTIGTIVVTTSLQIPSAIFTESFLSFLGLGVQAPMPSLGSLAADAIGGITSYTYRLVAPAITISIVILAFNLFGDGLRDALDPRLKK